MKTTFVLSILLAVAAAREISLAPRAAERRHARSLARREVPQEHSHEKFLIAVNTALRLNNPDEIADTVFSLLGAAAAAQGQGKIADVECLQQATADQAFTNAKAIKDIDGMTAALVFRTLEKNTGSVGLKSKPCTSIKAKNPEIAALQQHQDPASDGAAALNKAITLELAKQIASIGGDPLVALQSGTFAPGTIGDPTGAGNTCDDLGDNEGCIFTKKLLVEDATPEEIAAAVAGTGGNNNNNNNGGTPTVDAGTTTTAVADATTTAVADATTTAIATTTAVDAVATDCAANATVTVTVTEAAAATETIVVNNQGKVLKNATKNANKKAAAGVGAADKAAAKEKAAADKAAKKTADAAKKAANEAAKKTAEAAKKTADAAKKTVDEAAKKTADAAKKAADAAKKVGAGAAAPAEKKQNDNVLNIMARWIGLQ